MFRLLAPPLLIPPFCRNMRQSFSTRVLVPEKLEIKLTETESSICQLLDECVTFLKNEKGIHTSCRVAGGWVRDKLLGQQSHDIDIALSDIMGLAFAEHLTQYATSKDIELGHITKIEQNPDQSKHLETATLKVFGQDIDLVNLRSEEYVEDSRIPKEVKYGTPLEDSARRDMTINALFYNIHTQEVEDFTGKGLDDLREGIIRTPLPPKETFLDDPLRVLRCVRFASRLGFDIVPEVKDAARDRTVQQALIEKVSRERVGDEITKMLQGRDPLRAGQLICELELYHAVFSVLPTGVKASIPPKSLEIASTEALTAVSVLHALFSEDHNLPPPHPALLSLIREDPALKTRFYLAGLLLPYLGTTYRDGKTRTQSGVSAVIRESLRLGTQNHYLDGIPALFTGIPILKHGMEKHQQNHMSRAQLGLLLRNKFIHNPLIGIHWSTSIFFSLATELVPSYSIKDGKFYRDVSKITTRYNAFTEKIIELGLQDDVDSKIILSGNDIFIAFGVETRGPWVGKVLEDVLTWQLDNPSCLKEDCLQWLRNRGPDYYFMGEDRQPRSRKK